MTDAITMDDLGLPSTLYDPTNGTEWHLSDPSVDVQVKMTHPDTDGDETDATAASYPLSVLQSKVDRGDLQLPGDVETDDDPPERAFECDECGKTFDTGEALNGHKAVHSGEGGDG